MESLDSQGRFWRRPGASRWTDGIHLAALNSALALFSVISFMGVLGATVLLSNWLISENPASRSAGVPFPFPVLFLLYALLFIVAWFRFGRRLTGTRKERFRTASVGAMPLFGLSLLGYASVAWILIFGDFNANQMLTASVFVYTIISTLILCAGVTCVWVVTFNRPP